MTLAFAAVLGWALGTLPSAALAARAHGRSIFRVGSANMGAMNVARNLGWGTGLAVLLADVGKGVGAAAIGGALAGATGGLVAGCAAVVGHVASPWVGFRGGKGLATGFGAALPLYPAGAVAGLATLLLAIALLRRTAPAATVFLVLYPLVVALAERTFGPGGPPSAGAAALAAAAAAAAALPPHIASLREGGDQRGSRSSDGRSEPETGDEAAREAPIERSP